MNKGIQPRKVMATLDELRVGKHCPHENYCACRQGAWCPEAKAKTRKCDPNYPITYLTGCSFSYDHCCCRLLEEIEMLADEYLKRSGVKEPPVPLEVIHQFDSHRVIDIQYLPLKRYLGCTWLIDGGWVVYLNDSVPDEVRHYTAFHEGFHIICGSSGLGFRRESDGYLDVSERLADYFAASILMPKDFVRRLWPVVRDIGEMAAIFSVPEPVMKDWLARLCIAPT